MLEVVTKAFSVGQATNMTWSTWRCTHLLWYSIRCSSLLWSTWDEASLRIAASDSAVTSGASFFSLALFHQISVVLHLRGCGLDELLLFHSLWMSIQRQSSLVLSAENRNPFISGTELRWQVKDVLLRVLAFLSVCPNFLCMSSHSLHSYKASC